MSIAAPSHLLLSPTLPVMGVESVRRLHSDHTTLIIDVISIRKRALYHRSRAFLGVYFGTNYPLNTAYDLPVPYYRAKEESILALSAILAALKQLLIGLSDARFADRGIEKAIIRTNCRWAVHVLSSRAIRRERPYNGGGAGPEWDDDRAQTVLAKNVEYLISLVGVRGVRIQFWVVNSEQLGEARALANAVAAQRSKLNVLEFKIRVKGINGKFSRALGRRNESVRSASVLP
ncbi:hypothetical protein BKA64DRAFT_703486 [Cadophora sp. MPI-SDFR-AT-0126]|nr:hypothetical protein BKA64DRAFT_703486 [Leotiomycetes sp. MPI-SDFR-AT-0126]